MPMLFLLCLAFALGMAYWWWLQGLFSSFLHCAFVIIAGSLAWALWEPVAYLMLNKTGGAIRQFAWCLALLGPFFVVLTTLRVAGDTLVKANLKFSPLIDKLGGAVFGLISAYLTIGLFLTGFNLSPIAPDFMGYRPLIINRSNNYIALEDGGSAFLGSERNVPAFYAKLSTGAFAPTLGGPNLATAFPSLPHETLIHRQHADRNAFRVAAPGNVELGEVIEADAATVRETLEQNAPDVTPYLSDQLMQPRVVMVETIWSNAVTGAYDSGSTLRLDPASVLMVVRNAEGQYETLMPTGWVQDDLLAPETRDFDGTQRTARQFHSVNAGANDRENGIAFGLVGTGDNIGFIYTLGAGDEPIAINARHLRLPLPTPLVDDQGILAWYLSELDTGETVIVEGGRELLPDETYDFPPRSNAPRLAVEMTNTAKFPFNRISMNQVNGTGGQAERGVDEDGDPSDELVSAYFSVPELAGGSGPGSERFVTRVGGLRDPLVGVRVQLTPEALQQLSQLQTLQAFQVPRLLYQYGENREEPATPVALVLMQGQAITVYIGAEVHDYLEQIIRLESLGSNTRLYLYYGVRAELVVTAFEIGDERHEIEEPGIRIVSAEGASIREQRRRAAEQAEREAAEAAEDAEAE